jgi:hypothetical protein
MNSAELAYSDGTSEIFSARELFLKSKRFDLIVKQEYARNFDRRDTSFFCDLYLSHIRAFNNFFELSTPMKRTPEDYLQAFEQTLRSLKERGFVPSLGMIPIDEHFQLQDGAHRTAICALLEGQLVAARVPAPKIRDYDYRFFRRRGMPERYLDYAALQYVRANPKARVVTLHAVNSRDKDPEVETILNRHGTVFYKKTCQLDLNGYVNLKKLTYAGEKWIGTPLNGYRGARRHADSSFGPHTLRAYVFVCDTAEMAIAAKGEIRQLVGSVTRKHTVHITDTSEEAIRLAEALLNDQSLLALSSRPERFESPRLDERLVALRQLLETQGVDPLSVCVAGSGPMNALGLRESNDFNILSIEALDPAAIDDNSITMHDGTLEYYPVGKEDLILNPANHFFYNGLKFISIRALASMKKARGSEPKDSDDLRLIARFQRKNLRTILRQRRYPKTLPTSARGFLHRLRRLRHWRHLWNG